MEKTSKIYVAGHNGMVGSAIVRKLRKEGYSNLILRTSSELDLRNQQAVSDFFVAEKPDYVFLAAAKVGGIHANNVYRADFLYDNLMIQNNVIHQSYVHQVKKLLFLGSSCIYPKMAPQPLKEEYLLTGSLEETNEPYAIAKIAGIKMVENYARQYGCNFTAAMPTNLYGPNDNYNLENSHVLPALLRKIHLAKCLEQNDWDAIRKDIDKYALGELQRNSSQEEITQTLAIFGIQKLMTNGQKPTTKSQQPSANTQQPTSVEIWGTGSPLREFLHVDDLAEACYFIMHAYNSPQFLNVGSGSEISIKNLALLIKDIVGFEGELNFNSKKPDGTPRKLMHSGLLDGLGWKLKINLQEGIETVYKELKSDGRTNC